ncbi:hypothetical protein [Altererythrobacter sp. TH136]|uniref:hypothetical protein n=1 Tax=Altererythrobacter sp. TH136 TaxID=2067415 RepID=UPI0011651B2F|nr:hypothetical protein [Altererythrobacter sp. TH136]QDM39826.1 hypothetical protein C0V74_01255 [Altererythrobacter sp. TH136]
MRWLYDSEDETLGFVIAPVQWSGGAWWFDESALRVEAVEGFWIEHPWTSNEACPAPAVTPARDGELQESPAEPQAPGTVPEPTLAIGQVFLTDGPRRGRRDGTAYEAVLRVPPEELDASKGFRLRISGRLARGTGATPMACRQAADGRQRPVCLISTIIDEVAIENGASGETLAAWSTSGRAAPAVAPET